MAITTDAWVPDRPPGTPLRFMGGLDAAARRAGFYTIAVHTITPAWPGRTKMDPIQELAAEAESNAEQAERERRETLVTFRQILARPEDFDKATIAATLATLGVRPSEAVSYRERTQERRQLVSQIMTPERNRDLQAAIGRATEATHKAIRNRVKELIDLVHDEKLLLDLFGQVSFSAGHGDGSEWARVQWQPVHAANAEYKAAHVASNEAKAKLERLQQDYGILFGEGDDGAGDDGAVNKKPGRRERAVVE